MKTRFYSKEAIAIGTVFLTPVLGCILFAGNLSEVGKTKISPLLIIGSIIWTGLINQIIGKWISNPLIQLFLSNALASAVLVTFVWNSFLADYPEFEKRSPWKIILIFAGSCALLLLLQFWLAKI